MEKLKRGRPQKGFNWPQGNFTAKEIKSETGDKLSDGLIHIRIKEALSSGYIKFIGLRPCEKTSSSSGRGRPSKVYSLA